MKTKLLFIFLLLMQCKIFAQTISKQNLEIVCKEQHCSMQKADSILRNCAYIHFDTTAFNFGNYLEGFNATYFFTYTNIGLKPLKLINIQCSCGCCVPIWKIDEITNLGNSSIIGISYNTLGRTGKFASAVLFCTTNSYQPFSQLRLDGNVIPSTIQKK